MRRQTEEQVRVRKERIVAAAAEVFVRYGFAKTTMADIAKAAGVHRPVVYSLFPDGKDELFEAYLLARAQMAVDRYTKEIAFLPTMKQKLMFCALDWCTENFVLTEQHPEAGDSYDICYPAVRRTYKVLASFYADLVRPAVQQSALDVSPEQFAELFVFSLRGVRRVPETLEELQSVVSKHVEIFLAAVSQKADPGTSLES